MSQHYGPPPPYQYGASAQKSPFLPFVAFAWRSKPWNTFASWLQRRHTSRVLKRCRFWRCRNTKTAFSTEGYENEPPVLEELGVNFGHIKAKTLAVLNAFARIDGHIIDDSDLAGSILFLFLFGTFLLCSGKVHFGYIYGLSLMGSVALYTILSLMTPDIPDSGQSSSPSYLAPGSSSVGYPGVDDRNGHLSSTLTFSRSESVLGYCLLPLVMTSLLGIAMPLNGVVGYMLTSLAICWSMFSSSAMFCVMGRMKNVYGLVAYPVMSFYVGFGIMSMFSSRGSGTLGKAASLS